MMTLVMLHQPPDPERQGPRNNQASNGLLQSIRARAVFRCSQFYDPVVDGIPLKGSNGEPPQLMSEDEISEDVELGSKVQAMAMCLSTKILSLVKYPWTRSACGASACAGALLLFTSVRAGFAAM